MIQHTQHGDVSAFYLSSLPSRMSGYGVHMFVVRDVLIDCGFPGVAREVAKAVQELHPRGAFVTHHHEDHAGNVEMLARAGVPIGVDDGTLSLVRSSQSIGFYRHFIWRAMPPLKSALIPFSDDSFAILHTPGHCENHHAVWDNKTGTLFSGDLYLGVKVRVAHRYENPRELVQSLRAMAKRNPSRIFCAHRGLLRDGVQMLNTKADWIGELVERVDQRIREGYDDVSIRKELLGPRGFADWFSADDYSANNLIFAIRHSAVRAESN